MLPSMPSRQRRMKTRWRKPTTWPLAELFKGADTVYMLKMREIYRHLSNAADRGDEAANIISSIVMKHT